MANALKGEVAVTVAGKVWILLMDFNAMCAFEEETKLKVTEFMDQMENGGDLSAIHIRAFIWCMLLERQPDATKKDAGRVLSEDPDALTRALGAAFPDAEADTEEAPGEAKAAQG
ncbi:hypothetical protein [Oceaniovalibus sp. ACAM 378]|uniref:hypothetical protein n=1 Tax=Oceaniovalibus sp. ACAM 378 TaxID=2599923 RepID=UPI0011D55D9D|nr:hypothetical protein [Oceaniovalibus sp. ACAM 378]TYB83940.1 hypothetical protein FQ320_23575 [Oceaniovalibus sp. ACAM 378]